MKCPNCNIECPEGTIRCDCGFQLSGPDRGASLAGALADRRVITKLNVIAILLVLVLVCLGGEMVLSRVPPEQWQYTIAAPKDEELKSVVDKLGASGWELVSARRVSNGDREDPKMSYEMIFKKRGAAADTFPSLPR
jgi:hypothetical protein